MSNQRDELIQNVTAQLLGQTPAAGASWFNKKMGKDGRRYDLDLVVDAENDQRSVTLLLFMLKIEYENGHPTNTGPPKRKYFNVADLAVVSEAVDLFIRAGEDPVEVWDSIPETKK